MTIPAHELLSKDELPRKLRCCALTLAQIAGEHGMALDGHDGEIQRFTPLSGLADSDGIAVTYLSSPRFANLLRSGNDVAVITRPELRHHLRAGNIALIVNGDPHDVFYTALAVAVEGGHFEKLKPFLSPTAKIHHTAVISDNVHVEAGAMISAGAVILPNTYVGVDVVIKPNATVGGDGFEIAVIRGRRAIVPHAGGVWLSEGALVGSSTCIDRGLFGDFSFIGAQTTIDSLVYVAHSARTGKNCSLVGCSEISGSVVLGDGVWLGPNVSVNQGLTIGDNCYVGTGAVVTRNLPAHSLAYGSPAKAIAKLCICRTKLQFANGRSTCGTCQRSYRLSEAGEVQNVER